MGGFFNIIDQDRFAPGSHVPGNSLTDLEAELFHGFNLNIEGDGDLKFVFFQKKQRTGFDVHHLANHIHRVFQNFADIKCGRRQGTADLADGIQFLISFDNRRGQPIAFNCQ